MTDAAKEIAKLAKMPRDDLRERWQKVHGAEPPERISRGLMVRSLAYRIQEQEYGGLDKNTMRRLRVLARGLDTDGEENPSSSSLKPGARLVREWHGKTYTVVALEEGFEFKGKRYRSLSRIAREITGSRWSGMRFFGLGGDTKASPHAGGDGS